MAAAVAAPTYTVTRETAATVTAQAVRHALQHRTAVVISIPYDISAAPTAPEDAPHAPVVSAAARPDPDVVRRAAALLSSAQRPLILAGRGAHLAGAGPELQSLADTLGALTAGTALARNLLAGDGDLGIAGGFGTEESARLMAEADVVLVAGARLNQFTMRFGRLINDAATVIQVDVDDAPRLGLASAVGAGAAAPASTVVLSTGDGGLLMALADLESVVRTVRSGVIVVFNDAAYGAEIHQYGVQGVTMSPMMIPDVDFAGMARALGAQAATVHSLKDLDALRDWAAAGARGVFLADCRVSMSIRAPYMAEIVEAAARAALERRQSAIYR